jgi:peptide/nickel transport system permease protein
MTSHTVEVALDSEFGAADVLVPSRRSRLSIVLRNPLAVIGGILVLTWILLAIAANWIAPYDPITYLDVLNRLAPPSPAHLMGTDADGRDLFSRVIFGGRYSLGIGLVVVLAGLFVGVALGTIAGFFGGFVDEVIMRIADIVLAFPIIILAMSIAAALGPSPQNAMLAMILVWWPTYARVARGLVLDLREREFVIGARIVGSSVPRILMHHIVPHTIGPVVVLATLDVGNAILTVAGLSFINFGVPAPTPEWGNMISAAQANPDQWWIAVFPGLAIFTVIMGFNFFGDALRDALDPRTD